MASNSKIQAELLRLRERTRALQEEKEHFKHLLEAEERERRLIGYEIHDGLAQLLAAAMLQLSHFKRCLAEDENLAWQSFDNAIRSVAESLQEARRLIHGLGPEGLEERGVVTAIENLISDAEDPLQVEFIHNVRDARLPPPLEHAVFRIVQEGQRRSVPSVPPQPAPGQAGRSERSATRPRTCCRGA